MRRIGIRLIAGAAAIALSAGSTATAAGASASHLSASHLSASHLSASHLSAGRRDAGNRGLARAAKLARPDNIPPGWDIVESQEYTVSSGAWLLGKVTCPGTELPTDGEIWGLENTESVTINSSFPDLSTRTWIALINNESPTTQNFYVLVVCLNKSAKEQVVTTSAVAEPEETSYASAACPAKTVVVGGGVESGVNLWLGIDSTVPDQLNGNHTEWTVAMSNASGNASDFSVYAVCRPKPPTYLITYGGDTQLSPGGSASEEAVCPNGSVPVGGGGFVAYNTDEAGYTMNDNYAVGGPPTTNPAGWWTEFSDGSSQTTNSESAAVCAS